MVALGEKGASRLSTVQNNILISSIGDSEKMKFQEMEKFGKIDETLEPKLGTKIYKRRWLQIGLLFLLGAVNSMQWIQFTIIGNIVSRYYGVSSLAVDWTSILFHVAYMIMFLPASYVMDRVGLRWTCLIGSIGTSIGAWIKVFSVSPDRFLLLFIGQTFVASSQIFVLNAPPRLAANWFGSKEVATATAIGCSGGLAGISLFFLITPIIIKNHERIEDIGDELSIFLWTVAAVCTVVTVALFFFFQDQPDLPPSEARAIEKRNGRSESEGFWSTFGRILTNKSYLMLWNSYGMSLGYLNAASTLMNPLFLAHFENGERDAGKLGLLMNLPGNFGAIVFGLILDKTKKFKALSIFIYVFSLVGQISFAIGLGMEIEWLVFASVVVIGIFTISHASIGFELSAEATYPEPGEFSSSLLNMSQHVYGTTLVLLVGSLLRTYGDTAAHVCLTGVLTLGLILTLITKNELRRQNAREDLRDYDPVALVEFKEFHQVYKNEGKTYYNVSSSAIEWTGTIYCVAFIILLFPLTYLMKNKVWLDMFLAFRMKCLTAILTIGLTLAVFTKNELRRKNAGRGIQYESQIPSPS